ncbi:unnamed protein product [Brassica rapa]|uniref:Uncharacterized protein n=1 Tax=Brassica campestris TaxID=3711 RepID=A0A8D9CV04_BRACM|nr:unnamed protein product [Brassica rapa]
MDSHRRPVCADGHTRIHKDSQGRLVCADGHPRTSSTDVLCVLADTHGRPPTWAKITQTVHGKGQRVESKDQHADMCTDGQPRTTNVLICVLMDSHRRLVCADGHTRTAKDVLCVLTDTHGYVLCVLTDTHGRPVCTSQTAHVGQNHPNSPREGSAC